MPRVKISSGPQLGLFAPAPKPAARPAGDGLPRLPSGQLALSAHEAELLPFGSVRRIAIGLAKTRALICIACVEALAEPQQYKAVLERYPGQGYAVPIYPKPKHIPPSFAPWAGACLGCAAALEGVA